MAVEPCGEWRSKSETPSGQKELDFWDYVKLLSCAAR
jgi:hypothetical protein